MGVLAPYRDHLERRWAEGCRNGALLWRELVHLGFVGRYGTVRSWAGKRRKTDSQTVMDKAGAGMLRGQPPSSRHLARMLMTDTDTLPEAEQAFVLYQRPFAMTGSVRLATPKTLTMAAAESGQCMGRLVLALLAQAPDLADGIAVAKRLNLLFRRKSQESLDAVLADAAGTPLAEFAASIGRDLAAVQAALDLPWTTSPAEGQINRLKMLKRTMYGRAGFQLLHARVLHAA